MLLDCVAARVMCMAEGGQKSFSVAGPFVSCRDVDTFTVVVFHVSCDADGSTVAREVKRVTLRRADDVFQLCQRGRLYLPREYLDEAGVPHDPLAALAHPHLPRVCARLAAVAQDRFRAAENEMKLCDRRAMKPARLMGATYAAILTRLEQSRWERPAERISLPKWQKLWLACRYGLF